MSRKLMCLLSLCLLAGFASSASAWTGVTVGDDLPLGDNSLDAATGTFTIRGDGHDIWDNADDFRYVYKYLTGDGTLSARVVSMGPGSNTWAKAGVMMRETLAGESRHAMQVMTDQDGGGGSFQQRQVTGGGGSNTDNGTGIAEPYYVKIERIGDGFNGYVSADGVTWTQQGGTVNIAMRDKTGTLAACYIGLCVTSHATGELREAKFDKVVYTGNVTDKPPAITKAWQPVPADGGLITTMGLFQWTKGDSALFHDVYFGTDPAALTKMSSKLPYAMYYHMTPLTPGTTYYWRVDEIEAGGTVYTGDVWSVLCTPVTAFRPVPADGAQGVSVASGVLSWTSGLAAIEHQVYLSTNKADVESGAAAANAGKVTEARFDAGVLRASSTYYWRVDEIGSDVKQGPVWSFSTSDGVVGKVVYEWWSNITASGVAALTADARYPGNPSGTELRDTFDGRVDWADNYGCRLYGWLKPPETGDYTFWTSGDDETQLWLSSDENPANLAMIANLTGWTPYADFDNTGGGSGGASQKSVPITLQAGKKYYMQVLSKDGGGGDSATAAWQGPGIAAREIIPGKYFDTFALPPLQAFSPSPANGDVNVVQTPALTWNAGEKATSHAVFFGDDANAVAAADAASALFKGNQTETSFDPGSLEWNKTYFWRVDETNGTETWKGNVWSFTTRDYVLVDDFESYNDEENQGTRIYETWIDGVTNGTTSTVGNWDPPFAEQTIVHGGAQAMPMDYNNILNPYYAEAEIEFSPVQNWTTNGVSDLSLWFCGRGAESFVELAGGKIRMSGAGADIWGTADEFRYVYKTLAGDGWMQARVVAIGEGSNTWAKGGVMIRDGLEPGSTHASMVMTGSAGQGASFQRRLVVDSDSSNDDYPVASGTIAPPYWVKMERKGDKLSAFVSPDGVAWTQVGAEQTIAMTAPVYIGLCVTSHASGEPRGAEFDSITTSASVTGAWKVEDVGVAQGSGNYPDKVYVMLEDSTGKTKVVYNSDPTASVTLNWTNWKIPLSQFSGISLSKVKGLYIGVGTRKGTAPTGGGRMYIDDIRVVKPAP